MLRDGAVAREFHVLYSNSINRSRDNLSHSCAIQLCAYSHKLSQATNVASSLIVPNKRLTTSAMITLIGLYWTVYTTGCNQIPRDFQNIFFWRAFLDAKGVALETKSDGRRVLHSLSPTIGNARVQDGGTTLSLSYSNNILLNKQTARTNMAKPWLLVLFGRVLVWQLF